jgi:type II secretory pathway component PulF
MLFSARLPVSSLIELCRALRHNLSAGLTLRDVFRQQARQGSLAVRPVAERMRQVIERGDDLETALNEESKSFPPLFLALASVGERSGNLPEVFAALEKYYIMQQRMWRQFIALSAWPAFEFIAAIFVIAGMILLIGVLSGSGAQDIQFDPLGIGTGPKAAVRFLLVCFGSLGLLIGGYFLATRSLRHRAAVDRILLRIPVVGPCLEALALSRFCLALRLTMDTSLSAWEALDRSLKATGNGAFMAVSDEAQAQVRSGENVSVALASVRVFPQEFINILANAEHTGQIPEMMRHQAEFYEEEASRRLVLLSRAAGIGIWLFVGSLIVWVIFRFFLFYIGLIDPDTSPLLKGPGRR